MKSLLLKYAHYNLWANTLIFDLIAQEINSELLEKEIVSSFPSIRMTTYHMWDAEYIWMKRLNGESPGEWPSKNFNGAFRDALHLISETEQQLIAFIRERDDQTLLQPFSYYSVTGIPYTNLYWEAIHHCFNHSTFHRGQLITILRQCNIKKFPSTDFINYCRMR